jgi:hypothetical protein
VAAWSKALMVLDCSNIGVVGSNFTRCMGICLRRFVLCFLVYIEAMRWADLPFKVSYQNV